MHKLVDVIMDVRGCKGGHLCTKLKEQECNIKFTKVIQMTKEFQNDSLKRQHLLSVDLDEELWEEIERKTIKEEKTQEEIVIEAIKIFQIYRLIYNLEIICNSQPNSLNENKELMMWIYAQLIYKKLVL